jgi:hypothetical protein
VAFTTSRTHRRLNAAWGVGAPLFISADDGSVYIRGMMGVSDTSVQRHDISRGNFTTLFVPPQGHVVVGVSEDATAVITWGQNNAQSKLTAWAVTSGSQLTYVNASFPSEDSRLVGYVTVGAARFPALTWGYAIASARDFVAVATFRQVFLYMVRSAAFVEARCGDAGGVPTAVAFDAAISVLYIVSAFVFVCVCVCVRV